MISLVSASLQAAAIATLSMPAPPKPPPPYTHKVEVMSKLLGDHVAEEFKRCGDARTDSNGRSVEAMGTPRFSAEWKIATEKMRDALRICQGLRRALHNREGFLLDVVATGGKHDSDLAIPDMSGTASELKGIESFLDRETMRFRDLLAEGWGNPHCIERADGYLPPSSICPKSPDEIRPLR